MISMLAWSAVMLVAGTWWVRRDIAAYAQFKTLSDTQSRQLFYRRWLVESLVILTGASAISLWLAGAAWPDFGFPGAFEPVHRLLQSPQDSSGAHLLPLAAGISAGTAVSTAIQWRRIRKALSPTAGPDAALIPLNRREALLALLMSLNAGFSEELFFRLALPLLLCHLTGSLTAALAISTLCFGVAHAHYGWKGVLATTAAGALLLLYYSYHGSLLRVMIVHAVIDVLALFVRPALGNWIIMRKPPQWAASVS